MSNEPYEIYEYKGFKAKIFHEEYIEDHDNPRSWDPIGTMVCSHGSYILGDEHDYDTNDFSGWEGMRTQIYKDHDIASIRPIFMYDHSGITVSHSPFSCHWDSGQIGWHFVTKDVYRDAYGVKYISKKALENIRKLLDDELQNYNDYLCGEVYWWKIESDTIDESCSGFLGSDLEKSGLYESIRVTIDSCLENIEREAK